jgi:hypothetical protein
MLNQAIVVVFICRGRSLRITPVYMKPGFRLLYGRKACDIVMGETREEGIFLQLIIRPTTESGFWAFS